LTRSCGRDEIVETLLAGSFSIARGTSVPETCCAAGRDVASNVSVAQITLNNGTISATTAAGTLTRTYSVSSSGRGTATVNLPAFGSNDLVFYIIGQRSIEVMGVDNVTDDAIAFLHI
jgi:hypothetical protein